MLGILIFEDEYWKENPHKLQYPMEYSKYLYLLWDPSHIALQILKF